MRPDYFFFDWAWYVPMHVRQKCVLQNTKNYAEHFASPSCHFFSQLGLVRIKDNEKKAADMTRLPPLEQKVTRHALSDKDIATVKQADQLQLQKIQYNIRQSPKSGVCMYVCMYVCMSLESTGGPSRRKTS